MGNHPLLRVPVDSRRVELHPNASLSMDVFPDTGDFQNLGNSVTRCPEGCARGNVPSRDDYLPPRMHHVVPAASAKLNASCCQLPVHGAFGDGLTSHNMREGGQVPATISREVICFQGNSSGVRLS